MRKTPRQYFRILIITLGSTSLLYLGLLLFPSALFSYNYDYRNCQIYSDRPIDQNIEYIIDEANRRVSTSAIYQPGQTFKIFICNDIWKLGFFTQGAVNAGAAVQYNFTRYTFFRPIDIKSNKIIPAESWYFKNDTAAFSDRPLSYYFAHEMMHVMQSRFFGRGDWKYPTWLTEGYADYIAKGGEFDFEENLELLRQNAPELHPDYGLYRYYHLLVAYLIDLKGMTAEEIYNNPMEESKLRDELEKQFFQK